MIYLCSLWCLFVYFQSAVQAQSIDLTEQYTFSLSFLQNPIVHCVRPLPTTMTCNNCNLITATEGQSNVYMLFNLHGSSGILDHLANYTILNVTTACILDDVQINDVGYTPQCDGPGGPLRWCKAYNGQSRQCGNDFKFNTNAAGDDFMMMCMQKVQNQIEYYAAYGNRVDPTATSSALHQVQIKTLPNSLTEDQLNTGRFLVTAFDQEITWFAMMDSSKQSLLLSDFQNRSFTIDSRVWFQRDIGPAHMISSVNSSTGISTVDMSLISDYAVTFLHATNSSTANRYQSQTLNLTMDGGVIGYNHPVDQNRFMLVRQKGVIVTVDTYTLTWSNGNFTSNDNSTSNGKRANRSCALFLVFFVTVIVRFVPDYFV